MADEQTIEDLKQQLATQARTFEERLSEIEANRGAGGQQEASAGGDQPPTGFVGGFAASRRLGVTTDIMLQPVGDEVDIAGGSSLAVGSREISRSKSAVPKFGT